MKKPLSFLSTLLLSSAVTASTTACNNHAMPENDLKSVLTTRDLGVVPEENPGTIPQDSELKNQLFNLNNHLDIKSINITNKTKDSAFVVGDGIFYPKDEIKITYQIETIDISSLIVEGASIGNFRTNGQKPTIDVVFKRIHEKYPNLEMNHLSINDITTQTATIKGDNILYTSQVSVKFSTNDSVDLSDIIKKDLTVKTNGEDMPTIANITTALHDTYHEKLNIAVIAIQINNASSVTISSNDSKIYTGQVIVNLNLDVSIALKDVINKGLPKIAISGNTITVEDIKLALTKQYPKLKINEIEITLNNNSVTIKFLNKNIYTGNDVVINNLLIDLSSVLKNTLPTFTIPGKNEPTTKQLVQALKTNNINLNVDNIIINKITDSSAMISGDGKFYSNDNIMVTYSCDKAERLSDVFKNLDLGIISSNGLTNPNVKEVIAAIGKTNPNLKLDAITFNENDITNKTVVVSGDAITYKGSVTAHFIVDSSTINIDDLNYQHSETNSVGSSKTTWTSSDITLLSNWTNYASDWDSFSNKFSKLSFGDNSYFSIYCYTYTDQKLTGSDLSIATNEISGDRNKNTFKLEYYYDGWFWGAFLQLDGYIHIWHDDQNVYVNINWSIDTIKCFRDRVWNINLQDATFS